MLCESCQCIPCDCNWGNDEFWGILQTADHKRRENHNLVSQPDRGTPEPNSQVANKRKQPKNRLLSKDLYCTCNFTGEAHKWDNTGSSRGDGDRN